MLEINAYTLQLLKIIPPANKKLFQIFSRSLNHFELTLNDYFTIRDLLVIGQCPENCEITCILILLFNSLNIGETCIAPESEIFHARLKKLCGEDYKEISGNINSTLKTKNTFSLITENEREIKPIFFHQSGNGKKSLYFFRHYLYEKSLYDFFQNRFNNNKMEPLCSAEKIKKIINDIFIINPAYINNEPITPGELQKIAFAAAFVKKLLIISGGPGTGKTSIVFSILRGLLHSGVKPDSIKIAAPTGKASKRMIESLNILSKSIKLTNTADDSLVNIESVTIHRLLGSSSSQSGFYHNSLNRISADYLIIDESSMIDLYLMFSLFNAIEKNCRIILLGDKDQLPSVDAGAVLSNLIPEKNNIFYSPEFSEFCKNIFPDLQNSQHLNQNNRCAPKLADTIIILEKSYRSDRAILEIAEKINSSDLSAADEISIISAQDFCVDKTIKSGCHFIDFEDSNNLALCEIIKKWISTLYLSDNFNSGNCYAGLIKGIFSGSGVFGADEKKKLDEIFEYIKNSIILTLIKKTPFGAEWINGYINAEFHKIFDSSGTQEIFSGMPVIILKNNYSLELFNGDTGVILRTKSGYRIFFRKSDNYVSYSPDEIPEYSAAFAVTAHKSQGSEYTSSLLILPDNSESMILSKEILYTAITRAKKSSYIAGKIQVLKAGIEKTGRRLTGILYQLYE